MSSLWTEAEAVQLLGSKEAFQSERVIGQLEIDRILTPSIRHSPRRDKWQSKERTSRCFFGCGLLKPRNLPLQKMVCGLVYCAKFPNNQAKRLTWQFGHQLWGDAYESLPLHLEPLPETEPPPPPGWASTGRGGGAPISQQKDLRPQKSTLPVSQSSESHLAWFRRLESTTLETKEQLGRAICWVKKLDKCDTAEVRNVWGCGWHHPSMACHTESWVLWCWHLELLNAFDTCWCLDIISKASVLNMHHLQ